MSTSGPPYQTSGFQTTIDIARRQTTNPASYNGVNQLAGRKRSSPDRSEYENADKHKPDNPLRHGANPTRRIESSSSNGGFVSAASVSLVKPRIVASAIRPGGESRAAALKDSDAESLSKAIGLKEDEGKKSPPLPPASIPDTSQNPLLSLNHGRYGLPSALVANFASLGVTSIYPWQASCLLNRGLLEGKRHLVYTAPTGGGKSLVADVLMLKRVIENPSRKAILVLPYVALVQEKLKWLRRIVENVEKRMPSWENQDEDVRPHSRWRKPSRSIRVTGFFGGSRTSVSWADTDIAVCTIEKANSLINTAIEECNIGDLAAVVLDELHMLDDEHRGYLLELMVTKLLLLRQEIQIVGMSATLSNTELLAQWLDARFFVSTYRPIPIEEYLVYNNNIYPAATSRHPLRTASKLSAASAAEELHADRTIQASEFRELANPVTNAMVSLAVETATAGFGALVFCGSRQACQIHAALISEAMPDAMSLDGQDLSDRLDLLAELRSLPCGLDPVLEKIVARGVGFHHAGMTTEERELIAQAYDQGTLKVLVATCSLAAGVNLPARRVIMNGARMGRDLVGPAMLRQMCGRAGRKGKDKVGETYLICGKADLEAICDLLEAEMPAIASCLSPEKRGLKRALLEGVAVGLVSGHDAIKEYTRCTLLYRTTEKHTAYSLMESALRELLDEGLLYLKADESYEATSLGQAVVASAFSPEDGLFVYEELKRALQAFVMDGDMHIFYMFTPLQATSLNAVDWTIFRDQLYNLDESGLRALQFVGVQPGFVNSMAQSGASLKESTPEQIHQARIYRRAYAAFQLRDLSNEIPISTIAERYRIPRGSVQSLAQHCHGFAAGIVKFCQRMGWGMLAAVLDHMRDRLEAGARADLLEMAQVTFVKSWTARLLRENGFRDLRALAEADPKDLVPVLMMVNPRKTQKSQLHPAEAERYAAKLLVKAEIIVASANKIREREMQVELDE